MIVFIFYFSLASFMGRCNMVEISRSYGTKYSYCVKCYQYQMPNGILHLAAEDGKRLSEMGV